MKKNTRDQENDQSKKTGKQVADSTQKQRSMPNASPSRGNTTDMGKDALSGIERGNEVRRGSGITTKNNVTGSDYDGQVSGE